MATRILHKTNPKAAPVKVDREPNIPAARDLVEDAMENLEHISALSWLTENNEQGKWGLGNSLGTALSALNECVAAQLQQAHRLLTPEEESQAEQGAQR